MATSTQELNPFVAELRPLLSDILQRLTAKHGGFESWESLAEFQRELGKVGWGAPKWPVEIGGKGLDVLDSIAVDAEFHRQGAPRLVAVYGTANVGPTIHNYGTDEQKKHLDAMRLGEEFWCQGFSEPDFGSDLGGLRCRADVTDDGFIINGQKIWTSIGMHADYCMLLVRTDFEAPKHAGISVLLVPLDTPGITRRPIKQINGQSEFAEVFYENVFVPKTALLGPLNEGWRVTMTTLGFERAGVVSMAGQMADEATTLATSDLVRTAHPALQQRAMKVYSNAQIMKWTGNRALADMNNPEAATHASAVIKHMFSSVGPMMSELNADLAGLETIAGDDHGPRNGLLGSRASTIAGGTTEVMLNILGERNLGLPREPR